ncbi:hypothetical protein GLOTRDRAFT_137132 [Gloeophyllum trabeum ATCC 11539]|uniref:Telomere length regulation protein conserved domain-containing protein n=1 Tax=Gloeophyllum trabeum (strain ATCC 11539 / FP-39264 / Madison 617) TaxID=670483 RepID=S7RYC6_GLOTA|nr:uncharacterized protein GLOTRDRAFT_137132 [Gloeophyllum trabeum ATCC 11539]EPQ58409.1 hypothetical protein GLOTRDRAFT_137132 [Gloeophyllum trabeum ATCC 11539]
MSAEYIDATVTLIHEHISRLQQPISSLPALTSLLYSPLSALSLVRRNSKIEILGEFTQALDNAVSVKHIPLLQRALLEHIVPRWWEALEEEGSLHLLERYFYPLGDESSRRARDGVVSELVCSAYTTLLSVPLNAYSLRLLATLVERCPVDRVHHLIFDAGITGGRGGRERKSVLWEDFVRNAVAVPGKVANAVMGAKGRAANGTWVEELPEGLDYGSYFDNICVGCEALIADASSRKSAAKKDDLSSISYLLAKLMTLGLFLPTQPSAPSQPSFFRSTLQTIRTRISSYQDQAYSRTWQTLILSLPSSHNLRTFLTSLLGHLELNVPAAPADNGYPGLSSALDARLQVKYEALLLRRIVGALGRAQDTSEEKDKSELWESITAVVLGGKLWGNFGARVVVCWVAGAGEGNSPDTEALQIFLDRVTEVWTTPEHIKHSLLSFHRYMTLLMLLTLSHLPSPSITSSNATPEGTTPLSVSYTELAFSPPFIKSISQYISHLDSGVRACGMIVAERVAARVGKKIGFEIHSQDGWVTAVETLLVANDVDAEGAVSDTQEEMAVLMEQYVAYPEEISAKKPQTPDSDDDSLISYSSSRSRSPSPTPSLISDIEKDPTLLGTNNRPIPKPVYLLQLGEMLRGGTGKGLGGIGIMTAVGGGENEAKGETWEEAARLETALNCAEELIRKRRGFGAELEENAVNLAYALIGLQNNYELEGFNVKRQAALNALVACCPRKAAPTIIEQFFINQYSTDQRYVMLNALAMGARELASLSIPAEAPVQPLSGDRVSFPSKRLPPSLHRKYLEAAGQVTGDADPVQKMLMDISKNAIDKSKEPAEDQVPELVRERRLRVRQSAKVAEVKPSSPAAVLGRVQSTSAQLTIFTEVAAEFFICPLINRFWLFLRDEQAREERTSHHQDRIWQYRAAGTGLILNPVVLSHFIATLAVLVHAARNAKEWLAVIAPDALELAVTLGTRPMSKLEDEDEEGKKVKLDVHEGLTDGGDWRNKEAAVLSVALELTLVVLDGALDLDGGRTLGLEHTALLLGAGEWAGKVFGLLDKGFKLGGGGGVQEVRLRRAAAGVLLKVDELTSKWRRSMISL